MDKAVQLWTSVAMIAVLAHFSGASWPTLLIMGIIGCGIMGCMEKQTQPARDNKFLCGVLLAGIYVMISQLIPLSAHYWPGEKANIVIPLALVVMSIIGSKKRPERVGAVLCYGLILMAIPMLLAAIKSTQIKWVKPDGFRFSAWSVPVLLLPLLVENTVGVKLQSKYYLLTVLISTVTSLLVSGTLSPKVAGNSRYPFRDMTRSLSMGQYGRFEAMGSVMITLGWYTFVSLLLFCADGLLKRFGIEKKKSVWLHGVALMILMILNIKGRAA